MIKEEYFFQNKSIIENKTVLDLACHDGESTKLIQSLSAQHIYAVDIRQHLVDKAKKEIHGNVDFFVHDITDYNFLTNLMRHLLIVFFYSFYLY
jgi:predicted RNA methylase